MADRIPDSEITPRDVYLNRRTFMRGGLLAATAAGTALLYRRLNVVDLDTTELPPIAGLVTAPHENGFWVDEAHDAARLDPQLQQLLRVLDRQGRRRRRPRRTSRPTGWTGRPSAAWCSKPRVVRPRRPPTAQPARRARLPHALRRGLVDGHSVGRLLAVEAARRGRADGRREVRRVRDAARSRADAGPEDRRARAGRTSRACAWTRRCTRSRCSRPASTARSCRRRTARRSAW